MLNPERVLADSGYRGKDNFLSLEEEALTDPLPRARREKDTSAHPRSQPVSGCPKNSGRPKEGLTLESIDNDQVSFRYRDNHSQTMRGWPCAAWSLSAASSSTCCPEVVPRYAITASGVTLGRLTKA